MAAVLVKLCDIRSPLSAAQRRSYRALASAAERARCERLAPSLQDQALLTRALVRTELATVTGLPPRELVFSAGAHGKPILEAAPTLAFNLSHTRGYVAFALALSTSGAAVESIGLDIEDTGRVQLSMDRLARRFFTARENAQLQARSKDARRELFFRLWTLKESWVKAHGLALAPELRRLAFDLSRAAVGVQYEGARAVGDFISCLAQPQLALALCLQSGGHGRRPLEMNLELGLPYGAWRGIAAQAIQQSSYS